MTKHNIVRILAGLSFLIFFCPFFQMCSESSRLKKEFAEKPKTQSEIIKEKEKQEKDSIEFSKEFTFSGYEMGSYIFTHDEKISTDDLKDDGFIIFFSYSLVLLFSLFILLAASTNKIKPVYYFSIVNLFLGIISLIMLITEEIIVIISQIKFGYYLFILNTLALIIFSKKSKVPNAV